MPEATRGASSDFPESGSSTNSRPLREVRWVAGTEACAAVSSVIVFHSPQDSHLPCQRGVTAPQLWQTKVERALAMRGIALSVITNDNTNPIVMPTLVAGISILKAVRD